MTREGRILLTVPFFLERVTWLCLFAMLGGCASQTSTSQIAEKKPFVSIFLLNSNYFRMVGGFAAETGLTHDAAKLIT